MMNFDKKEEKIIEVISECFVKPKYEVEAAKEPYYLTPLELVMLTIHPIQKGLLYTLPNPSSNIISNLLGNLRSALSVCLVHFYPLAGRFSTRKYQDEQKCTVFVDGNKGPGARLIHATAQSVRVTDILSQIYPQEIVHSLFDLGEKFVNYDCHTRPILSIQVTKLVDGVFIGFTMSHSVVDGTSFLHFISVLSEFVCSNLANTMEDDKPVLNYRPWSDNRNKHEYGEVVKLPDVDIEKFITRNYPDQLKERIFHFSSASMAMLKAKAKQERATHNISSFQALSALVWRSITKARGLSPDEETSCSLLVNARTRLDPPVTDCYFGNYLSQAKTICKVDELLSHELGWGAQLIHESIIAQDSNVICSFWKQFADLITSGLEVGSKDEVHGPNHVVIGGSARFNMYRPEFGLGRAVATRMGFGNKKDGKVTANPGCEGGGSVDLEICLRPDNMAALEADQEFTSFVSSA